MYYAEFFQFSALNASRLIPGTGDRSVIILDGRESSRSHNAIAADEAKKRGYVAYRLCKGETLAREPSKALPIVRVDARTDLQTISERINARVAP